MKTSAHIMTNNYHAYKYIMQIKLFKDFETNDDFCYTVWEFYVINCNRVLRKLICI
jgi:hypothetical protein